MRGLASVGSAGGGGGGRCVVDCDPRPRFAMERKKPPDRAGGGRGRGGGWGDAKSNVNSPPEPGVCMKLVKLVVNKSDTRVYLTFCTSIGTSSSSTFSQSSS